jgi:hypothetical protein
MAQSRNPVLARLFHVDAPGLAPVVGAVGGYSALLCGEMLRFARLFPGRFWRSSAGVSGWLCRIGKLDVPFGEG